jgi:tRNA(fMet)-specific endonuclease VapC
LTHYLLDTNVLSELIRRPGGLIAARIEEVGEANVCVSIIVAAELRYGAAKSGSRRLARAIETVLDEIPILPFEVPADREYGLIRAELEAAGTPIGGNDLLVAAHARAIGAILVTANAREFRRVRGLSVENWML